MARAIKDRDQHCQSYGCTQTQNLQIHHIIYWADGGTTSVGNGVCLCQSCHTRVHEGGYSIQLVEGNEQRMEEQFEQQQRNDDLIAFNVEKELRNDRVSFNQVRSLIPTRYRYRIVCPDGNDIRNRQPVNASSVIAPSLIACTDHTHNTSIPAHSTSAHSTRVEYSKPLSKSRGDDEADAASHVAEQSAVYRIDTGRYQVMAL